MRKLIMIITPEAIQHKIVKRMGRVHKSVKTHYLNLSRCTVLKKDTTPHIRVCSDRP